MVPMQILSYGYFSANSLRLTPGRGPRSISSVQWSFTRFSRYIRHMARHRKTRGGRKHEQSAT
jgi:hypothetical protein